MDASPLVSAWNAIINNFLPVFTEPTAQLFIRLVTGWILCTGRHTVTGILPFADAEGHRAHDAYHRFFPKASWSTSELWRLLTLLLVKLFYRRGIIYTDLDDTLFHRSGRKVEAAGWWRDAVRSTGKKVVHAWGLNLVVLTLRVYPPWGGEPLGLPINMRLHRKKDKSSLIDLAEQMLCEVAGWLPERWFRNHSDGFYPSLIGRKVPRTHVVSRMRRDGAIYELPRRKKKSQRGPQPKKGPRLPTPQQMARQVRSFKLIKTNERGKEKKRLVYVRKVIWYDVSHDPVLLVISRDPQGKEKDDFFVTTDLSLEAGEVVEGFSGRWSIEDTFRNTKQFVGGQQLQTWKDKGPERAAALSLWLYSIVWAWYLEHCYRKKILPRRPWYWFKVHPSFQDAMAYLRRALWQERIKRMFGKRAAHSEITDFLINALASAA